MPAGPGGSSGTGGTITTGGAGGSASVDAGGVPPPAPDANPLPALFGQWRYVRAVKLNTSATGAGVVNDVRDFPLAVALKSDFDFSQAKRDGSDLRFAKLDGTVLPHSIERWDPAGKAALVWVKIDLVKGDQDQQNIDMFWGNPDAPAVADDRAVFASSAGYLGVWHLAEDGGTAPGGFHDVTANAANATGVNVGATSSVEGRAGKGTLLVNAQDQWIHLDGDKKALFATTEHMTMSIWAKATSLPITNTVGFETLLCKGDSSWTVQRYRKTNTIQACAASSSRLCAISKGTITPGQWFHVAVVLDYPTLRLYLNGRLDTLAMGTAPFTNVDNPIGIGGQPEYETQRRFWDGALDEARVMSVSKDPAWVALDYESQRENQKLYTFGATQTR